MPFVNAHLEIFHCMHHPVIPKSDLYFTDLSVLRIGLGNGMNPSTPLNECKINVLFALPDI